MRHTVKNNRITRRGFVATSAVTALWMVVGRTLGLSGASAAGIASWPAGYQLTINFTTSPSGFGRIQRPYVAVWIEDAKGNPIRTVSLWMLSPPRGNRYLNELRRWYGAAAADPAMLPTTTSPTPDPGSYSVVWDGRDDKGKLVSQGNYYVCVESAREHGPYSLVRAQVALGSVPKKQSLGADTELKDVSVDFHKHA